MESIICLDASPLIDHYRKTLKAKTFFYKLTNIYAGFVLPVTALRNSSREQSTTTSILEKFIGDMLIIPY